MNKQTTQASVYWNALMLRAIASKCSKGMADVNDAEVLARIAAELEAQAQQNSAT